VPAFQSILKQSASPASILKQNNGEQRKIIFCNFQIKKIAASDFREIAQNI
jgi:hypothetical protein